MLATSLGVSAAYVLLGGRYSSPNNPHPKHRLRAAPFDIRKCDRVVALTSSAVTHVHGNRWMTELKAMCEAAETRLAMNGKELVRAKAQPAEDEGSKARLHEGDLYLCSESLNALEAAIGGVLEAVDTVFAPIGPCRAFVGIRPPGHHCSSDYPSGFCWLNNVHIGISHAASSHGLTHAAIIDFDLHHGDGSQAIAWAHNSKIASLPKNAPPAKKAPIGYFSLHDINSYPCEWGDAEKVQNASLCIENAHGQSIWNIHLQPWKSDADFWELYETRYVTLLDKVRSFLCFQKDRLRTQPQSPSPKAAIFISAGFDASEWEGHGMQRHNVNVPTDFYARFTHDIVKLSEEEGLGVDGRIVSVLEGGYSDRALMSGSLSHLCGLAVPAVEPEIALSPNGLGQEISKRLGKLDLGDSNNSKPSEGEQCGIYDTHWWSPSRLEELEALVNPTPAPAPRKPRGPMAPTYSTPTQSYTAKIVSPTTPRRSMSGSVSRQVSASAATRPASPPPPDVSWSIASHELSKMLIPTNRQTKSCRPEDLNAEATKVRRNRQSAVGVAADAMPANGARMQLRDRKTKLPSHKSEDESESRPVSRASTNRRKTIAGAAELAELTDTPDIPQLPIPNTMAPARRRASAASSIVSTAATPSLSSASTSSDRKVPGRPKSPTKPRAVKKTGAPASVGKPLASKPRVAPAGRGNTKSSIPAPPKLSAPGTGGQAPVPSDLDSLTTGIKKMSIKLKVPPKEEHDARMARISQRTKSQVTATTHRVVPNWPKNNGNLVPGAQVGSSEMARADDTMLSQPHPTDPSPSSLATLTPTQPELPPSFTAPTAAPVDAPTTQATTGSVEPNLFPADIGTAVPPVAYAPQPGLNGHPTSTRAPDQGSHALPDPSTRSPGTPKRAKKDLPVFTSTSPIPFGATGHPLSHEVDFRNGHNIDAFTAQPVAPVPTDEQNGHANARSNESGGVDIWAVPESPEKARK